MLLEHALPTNLEPTDVTGSDNESLFHHCFGGARIVLRFPGEKALQKGIGGEDSQIGYRIRQRN
jgi:hypothetical protein